MIIPGLPSIQSDNDIKKFLEKLRAGLKAAENDGGIVTYAEIGKLLYTKPQINGIVSANSKNYYVYLQSEDGKVLQAYVYFDADDIERKNGLIGWNVVSVTFDKSLKPPLLVLNVDGTYSMDKPLLALTGEVVQVFVRIDGDTTTSDWKVIQSRERLKVTTTIEDGDQYFNWEIGT